MKRANGTATISCIYNGYDSADFLISAQANDGASREPSTNVPEDSPESTERRLRIAYVGTLWNLTSIEPIVAAIQKVAAEDPEKAARIDLVVAGRSTAAQDEILDRLNGLPCRLVREGYVDHRQAIEIMRQADVQCLLLSDVPEAGRVVPAKTFEYLGLGGQILYVGPSGEVSEILSDFPQADSFLPADTNCIANYLSQRLAGSSTDCQKAESASPDRFERRILTGQLAEILNRTCAVRAGLPVADAEVGREVAEASA